MSRKMCFCINLSNIAKKSCFYQTSDLVLIYTLREADSRIFVTGGSVFARQKGCTKKLYSWGRKACVTLYKRVTTVVGTGYTTSLLLRESSKPQGRNLPHKKATTIRLNSKPPEIKLTQPLTKSQISVAQLTKSVATLFVNC